MGFPIKVCVVCGDEFELRPGKPGFANRCPTCNEPEDKAPTVAGADPLSGDPEAAAARRKAMRDMLYRKES